MADLFREVDEAMRQERLEKIWQENKTYIIGFVVGTILLTGILSAYRSWNASVHEKQTATMIAMQEAPDYPENILNTEKLKLRGGLRGIALLQAAGTALSQEKTEDAIALYDRAGADNGIPDDLQHLGIIMSTRLMAEQDEPNPDALIEKLSPVVKSSKSPWAQHARLEAAVIHANLRNDFAAAKALLNTILETENLPESLYQRAQSLNHLYSLKLQTQTQSEAETG